MGKKIDCMLTGPQWDIITSAVAHYDVELEDQDDDVRREVLDRAYGKMAGGLNFVHDIDRQPLVDRLRECLRIAEEARADAVSRSFGDPEHKTSWRRNGEYLALADAYRTVIQDLEKP